MTQTFENGPKTFRCERLNCELMPVACARRFARASLLHVVDCHGKVAPHAWRHLRPCHGCPVGEANQRALKVYAPDPPASRFRPFRYSPAKGVYRTKAGGRSIWWQAYPDGEPGEQLMEVHRRREALDEQSEGPPTSPRGAWWAAPAVPAPGRPHEALTLREIGEQLGVSGERVRQLQERALSKLRKQIRDWGAGDEVSSTVKRARARAFAAAVETAARNVVAVEELRKSALEAAIAGGAGVIVACWDRSDADRVEVWGDPAGPVVFKRRSGGLSRHPIQLVGRMLPTAHAYGGTKGPTVSLHRVGLLPRPLHVEHERLLSGEEGPEK